MPDFLLEIGCEEIPARMIDAASRELRERVGGLLSRERLTGGEVTSFETPRRIAIMAASIAAAQADVTEQLSGPSTSVAYKDGQPTPAALAFAKKAGIDVGKLERITTPKGEYIAAKVTKKGRSAADILGEALPKEIATIYWPRICTGASRMSVLCARCAGLLRCSTAKVSRWNWPAFGRGIVRGDTAS